jgi:hypothetical protein
MRSAGHTIGEIAKVLCIAYSTAQFWTKGVALTEEQRLSQYTRGGRKLGHYYKGATGRYITRYGYVKIRDKPARTGGLCVGHYHRLRRYGDPLGTKVRTVESYLKNHSGVRRMPNGYTQIRIMENGKCKWVLEHRHVMEQHLGRKLMPFENVHHVDGIKTNNKAENLELWVIKQSTGIRLEDAYVIAKQILKDS